MSARADVKSPMEMYGVIEDCKSQGFVGGGGGGRGRVGVGGGEVVKGKRSLWSDS